MLSFSFYERFRWKAKGYCRLCGDFAPLTFDHVPPQSCFNDEAKVIYEFPRGSTTQDAKAGVKFRSLCVRCNNAVLGPLDAHLAAFAKDVSLYVQASATRTVALPSYVLDLEPSSLFRGIVGHTIAAYCTAAEVAKPLPTASAGYFNDLREMMKPGTDSKRFRLHYWISPDPHITIMPFFTHMDIRHSGSYFHGTLIRFYPLAFWLVDFKDAGQTRFNLPFFTSKRGPNIRIDLKKLPVLPPPFPFNDSTSISLVNMDMAIHAENKRGSRIHRKK